MDHQVRQDGAKWLPIKENWSEVARARLSAIEPCSI
jgi:hypothetical protein